MSIADTDSPHAAALARGYTREMFGESDQFTLILLVKPGVNLDDQFIAWDTEAYCYIRVNGWLFAFNDC